MTTDVWTIVGRELREQARRPWTYGLRVVLAFVAVLAFALAFLQSNLRGLSQQFQGVVLFGYLQIVLFAAIWLVVPFLICDVLSREKREGTLGLLFLTPLRPGSVVVGKSVAHGLRALSLLAVFAPLMAVPWLAGGVGWREYVGGFLIDGTSIGLALSAGLLASALTRERHWAMVLAAALTASAFGLYAWGFLKGYSVFMAAPSFIGVRPSLWNWWQMFLTLALGLGGSWQAGGRNFSGGLLGMNAGFALLSVFLTMRVIRLAVYLVRLSLRAEGCPSWWSAWQAALTKPRVAKSRFKSKMRRALDRNPVGWLQQHRTGSRVTKWTWCLTVVGAEAMGLVIVDWDLLPWLHFWLGLFLAVGLSLSAAGSFQAERENGAFELLLATPLRESDIVWGRLRGLWAQFAPGFVIVLGAALWWSLQGGFVHVGYWTWKARSGPFYHGLPWLTLVAWLVIPVIGLHASLACRTFVQAWVSTLAWGFLLPGCVSFSLPLAVRWMPPFAREQGLVLWLVALAVMGQLIIAGGHWIGLQRRMSRREFQTVPT